jgi:outer membrane protein TolC
MRHGTNDLSQAICCKVISRRMSPAARATTCTERISSQIEQAKGRDAEALAAYRQAVLRATEDVENAFSALVNREEQAVILSQGEASLARARESSLIAYQNGAESRIDVLHADRTLLQTSEARAQAQTESARAAVAAFKALGGGWQPRESETVAFK